MISSLNAAGKVAALLVIVVSGILLASQTNFGPDGPSAEATNLNEIKKLLASDAAANDNFGFGVSLSGDTAVVGAHTEDAGGSNAGAAYVFQHDQGGAGNWGEVTKLTASDAQAGDWFGGSVAVSGDTTIVGAPSEDTAGLNAGAAYVFQRDQGGADNWGEVKKLVASDALANDFFGNSVAVSGDTVVVGAFEGEAAALDGGAAYIFQRDEGGVDNWGEVKLLTASDAQAIDNFGLSVAISGDTAVVGAYREDAGGSNAGAAYVFQRDQGGADNWGELKKLTASDAQAKDWFGNSVAVSGETTVVGARQEDAGGSDAGAAYVFQRNQGGADNWGEMTKLTASDAQAFDDFGAGVGISGDTAVVGAASEDTGGNAAGASYVFKRNRGGADNWGQMKKFIASDAQAGDFFGVSVAVDGDTAVAGARGEDARGIQAGAAYVFQVPPKLPDPGDTDGDGCADQRENLPKAQVANGGGRDWLNPWDYYDVNGDGVIDLPFDILGVIQHYAPTGAAPYDVLYDRGPTAGPNPWNMTAPDGVIDLPNDILGVVLQYNPTGCT